MAQDSPAPSTEAQPCPALAMAGPSYFGGAHPVPTALTAAVPTGTLSPIPRQTRQKPGSQATVLASSATR